jgi:hypothetical protein
MIKWLILAALLYLIYRLIRSLLRIRQLLYTVRNGVFMRPPVHRQKEIDITDRVRPVE